MSDVFNEVISETSDINDGNLDFRFSSSKKVIENRKKFFSRINIPINRVVCMNVTNHKDDIRVVGNSDVREGIFDLDTAPRVDALVTAVPNIYLMLLTADCIPASIYDPKRRLIALVHLSRETTVLKLAEKVLSKLENEFSAKPSELFIKFGPHIKKDSYSIDITKENLKQFIKKGVRKDNISVSEVDTYRSPDYFSFRRSKFKEEKEGRFATILGIK